MPRSPHVPRRFIAVAAALAFAGLAGAAGAKTDACGAGASALSDAKAIAGVRGAIARACPCADFDGSTPAKKHGKFVQCAKALITRATGGTPVLGAFTVRTQCRRELKNIYSHAACGYPAADARVMCCEATPSSSKKTGKAEKVSQCVDAPNGKIVRHACYASPFAPDACSFDATNSCAVLVVQETVNIPSGAEPANTPGTSGVTVTNP